MSENPGGAVKVVGWIVLLGGVILSLILALSLYGMASDAYGSAEDMYNRIATIILIGGPVVSVANGIMLVAFGTLVENSEFMMQKTKTNR